MSDQCRILIISQRRLKDKLRTEERHARKQKVSVLIFARYLGAFPFALNDGLTLLALAATGFIILR
jgi:hypothetical protein